MKDIKKITFVINNLNPGGAEKILVNLLNNIDRERFKPTLFLFEYEGEFIEKLCDDIEIKYGIKKFILKPKLPLSKGVYNILKYILRCTLGRYKLKRVVKDQDIVVAYLEKMTTYLVGSIPKSYNVSKYSWIHTNPDKNFSAIHKILSRRYYEKYKKIFCVSQECESLAIKEFPNIKDKLSTLYNPIEIDQIQKRAEEKNSINMLNGKNIVAIGRLTYEKGFDVLVNSMVNVNEDVRLFILGEGNERNKLTELIKKLNLDNRVKLIGFVDNPYAILKAADLFVLSSRVEGLPSVLIEALALNKKIVSTKCSGSTEILKDGKYGELVEIDNPKELSQKINEVLQRKSNINGLERAMYFEKSEAMKRIEESLY